MEQGQDGKKTPAPGMKTGLKKMPQTVPLKGLQAGQAADPFITGADAADQGMIDRYAGAAKVSGPAFRPHFLL